MSPAIREEEIELTPATLAKAISEVISKNVASGRYVQVKIKGRWHIQRGPNWTPKSADGGVP